MKSGLAGGELEPIPSWITPARLSKMNVRFDALKQPILTESVADGRILSLLPFSPPNEYALSEYNVVYPPNFPGGHPVNIKASDFKIVDGIPLPFTIIYRAIRPRDGKEMLRWTASVHSYKLNDPDNKDERYQMRWPKGLDLLDVRTKGKPGLKRKER